MKGSVFIAAAAAAGASAASAHRRAHDLFAKRGADADVCVPGCQTIYTTIYGEPTLVPEAPKPSAPAPEPTPEEVVPEPETSSFVAPEPEKPTSTYVPEVELPTGKPEICPTPGEYEFPETTIVVTETATVCGAETTKVPEGTHTYGGVTTVVESATTVVCPYPTEKTESGVVTSVIETTTYVCPEAGTYTIAPTVTYCEKEETLVYPTITTVVPGTYTRPAVTTTVTDTNVVVVCPWTSKEPAPEPTYEAPAPPKEEEPKPEPSTEEAPKPEPTYEAPKEDKPKPQPPKEDDGDKEETKPPGKIGGGKGDHFAITYTPYSEDSSGSCKSASQVDSDIQTIKGAGFDTVRVYSTDCDTLDTVGAACKKHGLKMIIGVFVKDSCDPNASDIKEQIDTITSWKQWDLTDLIVVGNEALYQNLCDASSLKKLITTVKSKCDGAGFTGSYTTAETLNVWEQSEVSSELCGVVDFVGGQVHPYFNAETAPKDAGKFVKGQLEILDSICSGKTAINLECGWPTGGNANGKAQPGKQEQEVAIKSIREEAGDRTVFFSFHNDQWKEPGACGCEQSWGCGSLF